MRGCSTRPKCPFVVIEPPLVFDCEMKREALPFVAAEKGVVSRVRTINIYLLQALELDEFVSGFSKVHYYCIFSALPME